MPAKNQKKRRTRVTPTRTSEVLDVRMAAELLTVSPDTVYDLFKRGELPGRKVGRKWITTRIRAPLSTWSSKYSARAKGSSDHKTGIQKRSMKASPGAKRITQ
jgi:excisionase family DNA binding protein